MQTHPLQQAADRAGLLVELATGEARRLLLAVGEKGIRLTVRLLSRIPARVLDQRRKSGNEERLDVMTMRPRK